MGFLSVVPCYVPCGKWETVGIDSPWSARLGSGLEGVAQFSTLVLEEGISSETGLENVPKCPKKGSKFDKNWLLEAGPSIRLQWQCDIWIVTGSAASMVLHMFFGLP